MDEHEREVARLAQLLLLVAHDDGECVNEHVRVEAAQFALPLDAHRERTCG